MYRITPYYDRTLKKIRQRSEYMGPVKDGKIVERSARTYTYGELMPVMKAIKELNLQEILSKILGDYAGTVLIMAINRVIRPEAMNNLEEWYGDSYLSQLYTADLSPSSLSRILKAVGGMNPNHSFLVEILHVVGKPDAVYYDLTSFSSQAGDIEFLEYGYSRSDPDLPQVNVSLVESRDMGIPVFYDVYPGSVVDVTTVKNTVETLRSAGIKNVTFIMDRGMFSSSNIEYLLRVNMDIIMPASYTVKEVKKLALHARKTIEKGGNMIRLSGDILFAQKHELNIGQNTISAWVFYDPERDKRERIAFYSALQERMERLSGRSVRKWEKPLKVVNDIMGPYRQFISWKYNGTFQLKVRDSSVSQRINRCGITIIVYTGDLDAPYVLSEYRKRDSVEKLFLSSKSFAGGEPLRVHGIETLYGHLFVNLITLTIRTMVIRDMRSSGLLKKYSVEKMFLELHKMRKVVLQDGKEITTEITGKQKDILSGFSISPEYVPTFMKS